MNQKRNYKPTSYDTSRHGNAKSQKAVGKSARRRDTKAKQNSVYCGKDLGGIPWTFP